MRVRLRSPAFVDKIKAAESDRIFWDTELRGFGVRVKASSGKRYVVQYRNRGTGRSHGQLGGEVQLTWQSGQFVADAPAGRLDSIAANAKAERVFLKMLDKFTAQGRYVSANPGPTYAPSQFAGSSEAESVTKRALRSAMDSLFHRDQIAVAKHGSGAKERSHITRKA
ncbi:MAG: Arm DNA-binding domain-containing protein, partial [Boseongicola sp.]